MSAAEIALLVSSVTTLIQILVAQLAANEELTPTQKQEFIDRITAAQAAIPEWK